MFGGERMVALLVHEEQEREGRTLPRPSPRTRQSCPASYENARPRPSPTIRAPRQRSLPLAQRVLRYPAEAWSRESRERALVSHGREWRRGKATSKIDLTPSLVGAGREGYVAFVRRNWYKVKNDDGGSNNT